MLARDGRVRRGTGTAQYTQGVKASTEHWEGSLGMKNCPSEDERIMVVDEDSPLRRRKRRIYKVSMEYR